MSQAKLTTRGRVTIPRELRDRLGLVAGTRLVLTALDDGSMLLHVKGRPISTLHGLLGTDMTLPVTLLRR